MSVILGKACYTNRAENPRAERLVEGVFHVSAVKEGHEVFRKSGIRRAQRESAAAEAGLSLINRVHQPR